MPTTSFNTKGVMKLALVAAAAASLAACASRPKPEPAAPTPPPAPATQPETAPPPAPVSQAPIPGSEQDFVINVGDRVYFDLDEYAIRGDARPVLDAQAQWLNRYPNVRIRLEGNADERGTREYNFALGARRAQATSEYLAARGVATQRLRTISYGKERPVAVCNDISCWSQNRRAVTTLEEAAAAF